MYKNKIYPNSMTQRLIKTYGTEKVMTIWQTYGMYGASKVLSNSLKEYVSPFTLRFMSHKFNWKRTLNNDCPIYKGVKAGSVPAAYYKHLIFP